MRSTWAGLELCALESEPSGCPARNYPDHLRTLPIGARPLRDWSLREARQRARAHHTRPMVQYR